MMFQIFPTLLIVEWILKAIDGGFGQARVM